MNWEGGNVALARLEVGITPQGIMERKYPIYFAVGDRKIEIADFSSIATCQYYIKQAYKRFGEREPKFAEEFERVVAPWFEV